MFRGVPRARARDRRSPAGASAASCGLLRVRSRLRPSGQSIHAPRPGSSIRPRPLALPEGGGMSMSRLGRPRATDAAPPVGGRGTRRRPRVQPLTGSRPLDIPWADPSAGGRFAMPENSTHHEILVVGGGNGGISVAARLRRSGVGDIALVEPREHHLYQPLFSHVAGGTARAGITVRPQREVIPKGVEWVQGRVAAIDPDANAVTLDDGRRLTY